MRANESVLARTIFGLVTLLLTSTAEASVHFYQQIVKELSSGIGFLETGIQPDIANNGLVVFSAGNPETFEQRLYVGNGDWYVPTELETLGYAQLRNVEIDNRGNIVWTSTRSAGSVINGGVYRTTIDTTSQTFGPKFTIYEADIASPDFTITPARKDIALTSRGELFFSTIWDGQGDLFRGPVTGPYSLFQMGSGSYFNTKELDLNNAGEAAIQMEYLDPTLGLGRALFVFDEPDQSATETRTAVEKLGVSNQYAPDINNAGQVAFVVDDTATMTFFDPPHDAGGTIVAEVTLTPGIWLATPTPFGQPPELTQLVGTTTGFASFDRVLLDDFGRIVFKAVKTAGGSGIYDGPDPVADKIIEPGDMIDGRVITMTLLGKGNDWGQFTLIVGDFVSTDREVWRLTPTPEPGVALLVSLGAVGLAVRARARGRELQLRDGGSGSRPSSTGTPVAFATIDNIVY